MSRSYPVEILRRHNLVRREDESVVGDTWRRKQPPRSNNGQVGRIFNGGARSGSTVEARISDQLSNYQGG